MTKKKRYKPLILLKIDQLPPHIQKQIQKTLQQSLGRLAEMNFHPTIVIHNIEQFLSALEDLPEGAISEHRYQSKYNIHFVYVDPIDASHQYAFILNLDDYGQVVSYGLPMKKPEHTIATLTGKERALEQAVIFAKRKGYETKTVYSQLLHDKEVDMLLWEVWLEQSVTKINGIKRKRCRALSIDIVNRAIYKDQETSYQKNIKSSYNIYTRTIESVDS